MNRDLILEIIHLDAPSGHVCKSGLNLNPSIGAPVRVDNRIGTTPFPCTYPKYGPARNAGKPGEQDGVHGKAEYLLTLDDAKLMGKQIINPLGWLQ